MVMFVSYFKIAFYEKHLKIIFILKITFYEKHFILKLHFMRNI